MTSPRMPALKVDAHVLVQLGAELVTDAEQAILECVKNAYDADAAGCRIEIDTTETGTLCESGAAGALRRFDMPSESVTAEILDAEGKALVADAPEVADEASVTRRLNYRGRITIADTGTGMTDDQLRDSWLVVSRSRKRVDAGAKVLTAKGRTPLGDKGLGRLGSMKLGDILSIETCTAPDAEISTARFRWADCETASTVDEIPVVMATTTNDHGFKGTKVSVFGLKDLAEWQRKERMTEIAGRLSRLISPFEATSTFRVGIALDGDERSLASVTEEILDSCIARFDFEWTTDGQGGGELASTARFRRRLFDPSRAGKAKDKAARSFKPDGGSGFLNWLSAPGRFRAYEVAAPGTPEKWFLELRQRELWSGIAATQGGGSAVEPGPFAGAFYYFHLDSLHDDPDAASVTPVDRQAIKDMAGISVLREGFRVRSQGDWLELAAGMTSGSTYQLRVSNTVGYFSLTGRDNVLLVEKSDREGFVENAAYRGFLAIAQACRRFANESLESIRRAFDAYDRERLASRAVGSDEQATPLEVVERSARAAIKARTAARDIAHVLRSEVQELENGGETGAELFAQRAIGAVRRAVSAFEEIERGFDVAPAPSDAVELLRLEQGDERERAAALFESAAVGLSARGMVHELRTHLAEIRTRSSQLERAAKAAAGAPSMLPHLRAIRGACTEIQKAAALIDPMLPRSRSMKQTFSLAEFVTGYLDARASSFARAGVRTEVALGVAVPEVRANRPRLTQALDNLIRNAVYWTTRSEGDAGDRLVSVRIQDDGFVVWDTGPGVDPRYEDSLFGMFVSGRPDRDGGQGLGLFITRNLLEGMGCGVELLQERNANGRRYRFAVDLKAIVTG